MAVPGRHYVWPAQPLGCPYFVTTVGWAVDGSEDYDYTIARLISGSSPTPGELIYGDLDGFVGQRTITIMTTGEKAVVEIDFHSVSQASLKARIKAKPGCIVPANW